MQAQTSARNGAVAGRCLRIFSDIIAWRLNGDLGMTLLAAGDAERVKPLWIFNGSLRF